MTEALIKQKLDRQLHKWDIDELCSLVHGTMNDHYKEYMWSLVSCGDRRVEYNALWVFTHLRQSDAKWLQCKQDDLINNILNEEDSAKRRLMLTLLTAQKFYADTIRTDFLDYCLQTLGNSQEATGNRTCCIKLAYTHCQFYPELMNELHITLRELSTHELPTAVRSTVKKCLR